MRRHCPNRTATAQLCVLLLAACSGGSTSPNSVTRTDSAGVAIVVNHGPDHPLHWSFTPVLSLGGKDSGPEAFFHVFPTTVAVDSTGDMYILDTDNHRLDAFGPDGRVLWSIGHQGHGPGEFAAPYRLGFDPTIGALRVVDPGNVAIDRFALSGEFLGSDPLIHGGFTEAAHYFTSGKLIERMMVTTKSPRHLVMSLLVIRGSDTTTLRTVAQTDAKPIAIPDCPVMMRLPAIFTPKIVWGSHRDRTAVTATAEYTVWLYRGDSVTASVRRDIAPVQATARLAGLTYPNGKFEMGTGSTKCSVSGAKMAELRGYAATVPFVDSIALGPDGSIWVRRGLTADARHPVDLFDSTGAYSGSLPDSTPWPLAFMPNGDVVSAKSDTTTGVTKLVVYRVTR